jgi:putative DNA methylase
MTYRRKLIEVALPLPEINDASAYDKMPGIGPHPKGIHHWWARLPLPTARAMLFASVVDDPSEHPEKWPTEDVQNAERERLFVILRKMMWKKLHKHPEVYAEARVEMLLHCDGKLPTVFDPFAGGGSIPLEANRLGFEAHAGDLNPVAVLLNKCNLELAPRWANHPPVNPEDQLRIGGRQSWQGTHGVAADVRYYGNKIRERAIKKIGHLYPKITLPREHGGRQANVIAWIWARSVASPNPAAQGRHVPLISTYWLSSKKGNLAWLEPIVDRSAMTYRFEVRTGIPEDSKAIKSGTKLGRGANFKCLLTNQPIGEKHIKDEGKAGRLGYCPLAVVVETKKGRCYISANDIDRSVVSLEPPSEAPDEMLTYDSRYLTPPGYGMDRISKLFFPRQLVAMVTFSNLVKEIYSDIERDANEAGLASDQTKSYSDTITTFLALTLDRCADFNCGLSTWKPSGQQQMHLFTRQAISMVWDFAEANLLGEKGICWHNAIEITADAIESLLVGNTNPCSAQQIDAAAGVNGLRGLLVSTDPPYYDNVPYADISDFFYVWLRRVLAPIYPGLFSTVVVPKMSELTASPQRWDGDKERAKQHFESGFREAFTALHRKMDPRFPLTVYYAFKQADEVSGEEGDEWDQGSQAIDLTTGWETLLEALVSSGFEITGTWPVRASQAWRMRAMGSNALASYIVLACRARPRDSKTIDRRSFIAELKKQLPSALRHLQQGNIAPVDFAQASIGPGMAIYSRYSRVLESNGQPMSVRTALGLINSILTQVLTEAEEVFDNDTRWALGWFEQHGFDEGEFGDAELLSKAKVTSVEGLREAGIVASKGGRVRIRRREELQIDWTSALDKRLTVWKACEHLIYALQNNGEAGAAELLARLPMSVAEATRDLAYRLFTICERKAWAQEAIPYNSIVIAWPEIGRLAQNVAGVSKQQELL